MDYSSHVAGPESQGFVRLIKMHNLDITDPVDIQTPVDSLGGNTKLYFAML